MAEGGGEMVNDLTRWNRAGRSRFRHLGEDRTDTADDLTRWNRAGLSQFRYLDGNAATYLDQLRRRLQEPFPNWPAMAVEESPDESDRQWRSRLDDHYHADHNDMLWQLSRSFARTCHVLGEHLDTYANEASLGTATEWENLRKLVAMLDYHPSPPASAYTTLAIQAKGTGLLEAGFAVRHTPDEGVPVIFETLEDIELDPRLNELRLPGHDRNPERLSGEILTLAGVHDKLTSGSPLVIEDEFTGKRSAHLIQGVWLDKSQDRTDVRVEPPVERSQGFTLGRSRIHVRPKERLSPLAPVQKKPQLRYNLRLTESTGDLKAGEVVVLSRPGKKSDFFRVTKVAARHLGVHRLIGRVHLEGARLSRALEVPLSRWHRFTRSVEAGKSFKYVVDAAGDWRWLQGTWVSHRTIIASERESEETHEELPQLHVDKANYWPVGAEAPQTGDSDEAAAMREGYTTLTLQWRFDRDRAANVEHPALGNNPQYLLVRPQSPGPWEVDQLLNQEAGPLPDPLTTEFSKHAAAGDLAVVVSGKRCAWSQLSGVAHDDAQERSDLSPGDPWGHHSDPVPFFRAESEVYVHFTEVLRAPHWDINDRRLPGGIETLTLQDPVGALSERLNKGHRLLIDNGTEVVERRITEREKGATHLTLTLSGSLPVDSRVGRLRLYANTVICGHGRGKPELALGSGDATRRHQVFELKTQDVSFIPDASQASGVRAAAEIRVDGRRWQQIANLKDAGPEDAVYAVRLTRDDTLEFRFGDGRYGRRLPTGNNNVRIIYRQGVGPTGNLPAGSLVKPMKPHPRVETVHQPLAASGGAGRESADDLRQSAPASLLTLNRAVSVTDFARLARAHASIWQARAFTRPVRQRRELLEVVVIPAQGTDLSEELQANLRQYLTDYALPGVDVRVHRYQPLRLRLKVTLRVNTDQFEPEPVREAARAALVEAFSLRHRQLGQPLYRGEIYQVVEGVRGVANSTCEILRDSGPAPDPVIRVLQPEPNECLHLDWDHPYIDLDVEEYSP